MNYVVVLNIGGFWCDNAKNSVKNACDRWGISLFEIVKDYVNGKHIFYNKICGIKELCEIDNQCDGVWYLDGDILINKTTPNPFDLFKDTKTLYAVPDFDNSRWKKEGELFNMLQDISSFVKYPSTIGCLDKNIFETRIDWFFNAGSYLFYPKYNWNIILDFILNIPQDNSMPGWRYEQSLWNQLWKLEGNVQLIDSTWNYILSPGKVPLKMDKYVYHFTGVGSREDGNRELLSTYKWYE